ncbi:TRAP transporter substrate-binding protein [Parapusillimonas granuli]|uniref:TRAP transporter substrate-binding protein n=1 Tax=Parapusillimonas granuli TaxID=380911 RepID=A0A853G7B0_9BURK|nr:TRAP transporter substrate-binding protein [Parapusillimonas granuli]MBB5215851.1 TRAP-type mannitol/chloroaromatic compound transport system substrate-binding protein [Parapusillimonas granuli]MEB2399458.1 TRAP transporter substrate-binding protein [Alcaligenaceae bacterium]NYT50850.1 TRAP transporter substrate-binding protein [Parapusillimonas granuli]
MQRRSFLKKAGLGAVAGTAAVAAPALAQSNPKISWKMTSSYGPSLPPLYSTAELFCKMVSEATDGNFSIRLYPAGEIVPGFGVMDAVGNRTVECGQTASYYFYGKDPAFCFDTAVPFGLNARQMYAWVYEAGGMALLRELFAPRNIVNFPLGNTGTQMGGWYRKEIKSVSDLQGLKMRTAGFAGEVMSRMGVVPQQIPPGDIYPSLEKGTLDAVEFVGPVDDEKLGFQKVAKYYYYPGWWEGSAQVSLYVNDGAYKELPKTYQAVIEMASRAAGGKLLGDYDANNPAALRRLIAGGAVLKAFPRDVMDAAFKASDEAYKEFCAKSEHFKKIHDHYMAFRDSVVPWFRVGEGSYDNYLGIALANQKK